MFIRIMCVMLLCGAFPVFARPSSPSNKKGTLDLAKISNLVPSFSKKMPPGLDEPIHSSTAPPLPKSPIASKEIFSKQVILTIGHGKEFQDVTKQFQVSWDQEYKVIRIYHKLSMEVYNFWLADTSKKLPLLIKRADSPTLHSTQHRMELLVKLVPLTKMGILLPQALIKLGWKSKEIQNAERTRKQLEEQEERLTKLNQSSLASLPPISSYPGTHPFVLLQGQAKIFDQRETLKFDGIYTFGAGPCAILAAAIKQPGEDSPLKIGMAHLDSGVQVAGIRIFFDKILQENPQGTIEVSVISGEHQIVSRIVSILEERKYPISFFNADLRGDRSDAVAMDRKSGRLFYGNSPLFNQLVDDRELQLLTTERILTTLNSNAPGGGLSFR